MTCNLKAKLTKEPNFSDAILFKVYFYIFLLEPFELNRNTFC